MCFGVVRYTHLQRSYLVGGNGGILVFWCTKGKTGSRGGFAWSVPRYCGTLDLLQVLGNHLNKVRPHSGAAFRRWHWLGFDSATAQPVGTAQFIRILRPHLSAAMDVTSLSSYSFRRVLPTLAGYVGLSETERLALGQWTDQSSKTTATTPLRYDSHKQRLGHQLRLAGLHFFQDLHMALWDELPVGYAQARWETCMGDTDELLAADSIPYFQPKFRSFRLLVVASLQRSGGSPLPRQSARILGPLRGRGLQFLPFRSPVLHGQ